jgi:hypothetical protein
MLWAVADLRQVRRWPGRRERWPELALGAGAVVFVILDFALFGLVGGFVLLGVGLVLATCVAMAFILLRDSVR